MQIRAQRPRGRAGAAIAAILSAVALLAGCSQTVSGAALPDQDYLTQRDQAVTEVMIPYNLDPVGSHWVAKDGGRWSFPDNETHKVCPVTAVAPDRTIASVDQTRCETSPVASYPYGYRKVKEDDPANPDRRSWWYAIRLPKTFDHTQGYWLSKAGVDGHRNEMGYPDERHCYRWVGLLLCPPGVK